MAENKSSLLQIFSLLHEVESMQQQKMHRLSGFSW